MSKIKNAAKIVASKNTNEVVKTTNKKAKIAPKVEVAPVVETQAEVVAPSTITIAPSAPQERFADLSHVKRMRRVTIFAKSLTSVVKAMRLEADLNMSAKDCMIVCRALASDKEFASASVTTAHSDAMSTRWRKLVAILSDDEKTKILETLKTEKAKIAPQQSQSVITIAPTK